MAAVTYSAEGGSSSMSKRRYGAQLAAALIGAVIAFSSEPGWSGTKPEKNAWALQSGKDIPDPQPGKALLWIRGANLHGSTGCNMFTAAIRKQPHWRVAIEGISLTRMLCEDPKQNKMEAALVAALRKTEFIERHKRVLTFLSGDQKPLLVWKRPHKSSASRRGVRNAHARLGRARGFHRRECVGG
jgi:heat shock protein HslJ